MRGRPSSRSRRDQVVAEGDGLEDQAARLVRRRSRASSPRSGAASGASQMRKSSAPPELVVMIRRSPWCSTLYSWPCSRGATRRGGALGRVGVDQVDLGGLVVVRIDEDEAAGLRLADADVEADVLLLVDQHVLARRACRRGGGRRTAGAGWRRGARRTACGCRAPRRCELRVSGMTSGRSLPVARSRMRMVKSSEPLSSTA